MTPGLESDAGVRAEVDANLQCNSVHTDCKVRTFIEHYLHKSRIKLGLVELLLLGHELAVALVQGAHGDLREVPLHSQLSDVLRVRLDGIDVALEVEPELKVKGTLGYWLVPSIYKEGRGHGLNICTCQPRSMCVCTPT